VFTIAESAMIGDRQRSSKQCRL